MHHEVNQFFLYLRLKGNFKSHYLYSELLEITEVNATNFLSFHCIMDMFVQTICVYNYTERYSK